MKLKKYHPNNQQIFFENSGIAKVQSLTWIKNQKEAAKILKETMQLIINLLVNDWEKYTLEEINNLAEANIIKYQAIPTFKNYHNFPNPLCLSINHCLLHGIPEPEQRLKLGDKITIDFGVTYQEAIVDSARTIIIGENAKLQTMIDTGMQCLSTTTDIFKPEDRVGKIGYFIAKIIESKGMVVIEKYGGHAISTNQVHDYPFVPNKSNLESGIKIFPRMSLAVEPIILPPKTNKELATSSDGWSLISEEIGIHCEDSFLMTDHGLVNLTHENYF